MKGHVLIVADGRSPTALSWIKIIQSLGYQVSLVSSFNCKKPEGVAFFKILPIALSRFSTGSGPSGSVKEKSKLSRFIKRFSPLMQQFRYVLGPLSLLQYAKAYQNLVAEISPDFVHALRIPFEGMLGSYTHESIPFLVATWGNDLTLHARGSWLMSHFTQRCLSRANGLTSDTLRDTKLAKNFGLKETTPVLVLPGSGGVDLEAIQNAPVFNNQFGIPESTQWVVNPRGLRPGSVHQDEFFQAIPEVLKTHPNTSFICPGLKDQPQAHAWISKYDIQEQTFLLPKLPQKNLWGLFKKSSLFISPSSHDGTPNTLLEAMASRCFPVVGDIESLQEWIEQGINGFLVDPTDPHALAQSICKALDEPQLMEQAAEINREIIKDRAALKNTQPKIDEFYSKFI